MSPTGLVQMDVRKNDQNNKYIAISYSRKKHRFIPGITQNCPNTGARGENAMKYVTRKDSVRICKQWLGVLVVIVAATYVLQPVQTPLSPCPETGCRVEYISRVEAVEPSLETYGAPHNVVDLVVKYFGDDAQSALKIMKCESGFNPENIGDGHLMVENNGEVVGDSIGLMQIRTGGKGWNRAKANGMTADEFRNNLKNEEFNIKYAKSIFDKSGWSAWFNCMNKELK